MFIIFHLFYLWKRASRHPDLQRSMWVNPHEIPDNGIDDDGNGIVDDVHGADFANNDGDPMDDQMHGSHCGGTIAAQGNNSRLDSTKTLGPRHNV